MRMASVLASARFRGRHPGPWGWWLAAGVGLAGLRLLVTKPASPFAHDFLLPPLLVGLALGLGPAAWQWSSEDEIRTSWRRGLAQALTWNGAAWLALLGGFRWVAAGSLALPPAGVWTWLGGLAFLTALGAFVAHREATEPAIIHLADQPAIGLRIGHELQGAYWDDVQFEGSLVVFHSSYMVGWCAAGGWAPQGRALMVGLGSGAGAVGLLFTFPELTLTVIERSMAVRNLAERAFSVLRTLQDSGRLIVIVADAQPFLEKTDQHFDFGLGDAYLDLAHNACEMNYLPAFLKACDRYWFNCIGTPAWGALPAMIALLADQGRPICAAYSPNLGADSLKGNWLLTDCPHVPEGYAGVELYDGSTNAAVQRMQAIYLACMATNRVDDLLAASRVGSTS